MLNPPEVPTLRFYNTEKETFICVSANLFRQVIGLEDTELVTLLPTCGGRYRPSACVLNQLPSINFQIPAQFTD